MGMLGMFVLAVAIFIFVLVYKRKMVEEQLLHQQHLVQVAIEIQEEERKRFAADLHDEIGGGMSTVLLSLSSLRGVHRHHPESKQSIDRITDQMNRLLASVREISYDLTPNSIESFGLIATLSDLCYQIQENSNGVLQVDFNFVGQEEEMSSNVELSIYRICKELLTNTIKHAEASEIVLSVSCEEGVFKLWYADNGKGFEQQLNQRNSGMRNMMNRAEILGGTFSISTNQSQGMSAHLTLHLEHGAGTK